MLVAAVIVFIGAFAVPRYLRSREKDFRHRCLSNLRQISGGIDQWALEEEKLEFDTVSMSDAEQYLKSTPTCPAGGDYSTTNVAANPTCTNHGDILP